jgi:hypothetical protein
VETCCANLLAQHYPNGKKRLAYSVAILNQQRTSIKLCAQITDRDQRRGRVMALLRMRTGLFVLIISGVQSNLSLAVNFQWAHPTYTCSRFTKSLTSVTHGVINRPELEWAGRSRLVAVPNSEESLVLRCHVRK